MARGTSLLVLIGTRHGGTRELHLAGGSDGDEGGRLGVALREVLDQGVVPHPLAVGNLLDHRAVGADVERVAFLGVGL